ncbi:HET-domain-containing protein [Eremomyces bilateralis CBS 781.70]|uniref:HET-domain-containing protein n=1 Tax=Eremomyces bilateralis CBS 781.70 TaxID=1392243 RepID=A0A6G1GG14_9PEZI|nr:HET-domain-containing protein [Eremomyces bilateralis CBS 781.70]KAF1816809.1 HET-domain-containing protein [Eremomyces bilateralis CBS 781.70]
MGLLHSKKPGLQFEEFYSDIPSYYIISHTWYPNNQEIPYQDVLNGAGEQKLGLQKILKFKELVSSKQGDYFWVDTCCIDKTSSAELSEAINSMYLWYKEAAACSAYLSDVDIPNSGSLRSHDSSIVFKSSRWFTRGWTLQELLAPKSVRRTTTRVEDQSYSLMGLFGVNMPLLYGEGPKAFI